MHSIFILRKKPFLSDTEPEIEMVLYSINRYDEKWISLSGQWYCEFRCVKVL